MNRLFNITALLVLIFNIICFSQNDWVKWGARDVPYQIVNNYQIITDNSDYGSGSKILSAVRSVYSFLISDQDGDNCPFHPSCSHFFVESVNEAGIIKGSLMFADRFIRDLNFFKGLNKYPLHISGKFFDPSSNYTLNSEKIIYNPGGFLVK